MNGLAGRGRDYFVDCVVGFSEEERAIIRARDLHHSFMIRSANAPPSYGAYVSIGMLRLVSFLMLVGGLLYMIAQSFGTDHSREPIGGLFFFAGIALSIYSWLYGYLQDRRITNTEQEVTLANLLSHSSFTVHAFDPPHADSIEQIIRGELANLKAIIRGSAELQTTRTYEL